MPFQRFSPFLHFQNHSNCQLRPIFYTQKTHFILYIWNEVIQPRVIFYDNVSMMFTIPQLKHYNQ